MSINTGRLNEAIQEIEKEHNAINGTPTPLEIFIIPDGMGKDHLKSSQMQAMKVKKTMYIWNVKKRSCIKNSMIFQGLIKVHKKWIVIPANVGSYPFFTPKVKELRSLTKN